VLDSSALVEGLSSEDEESVDRLCTLMEDRGR